MVSAIRHEGGKVIRCDGGGGRLGLAAMHHDPVGRPALHVPPARKAPR
jgi:hypothetical protein